MGESNIDIIRKTVDAHSKQLAQCRCEDQKKDHDTLITIMGDATKLKEDVQEIEKTNKEQTDKLIELTGAINEVTDKVANLATIELKRKNFIYSIAGGILIVVLAALIIWIAKLSMMQALQLNKRTNIDNKMIMKELILLKKELKK